MNAPIELTDVGELDRRTYLGSSDIAAILGLSNWATPLDVYFQKRGLQQRDVDPAKERLFRRGKRLEPVILDMLAEEQGIEIVARGRRYRDPQYPWMAAEIDAEAIIDGEHVNVECKTVHPFAAGDWGEIGTDEVPVYYAAQAAYGQMVTGRSRTLFATLIGADNLLTYWIERDEETIAGIRRKAVEFWLDHVEAGVQPEPITNDDVAKLLRRDVDTILEADKALAALIAEFKQAKSTARAAEQRAEELKFLIGRAALGAEVIGEQKKMPKHIIMVGGAPALTIAYQEQKRIDSDAVRKHHPDVAEACSKTSTFFKYEQPRQRKAR